MRDGRAYFNMSNEQWETIFKGRAKIDKVLKNMDNEEILEVSEEEENPDILPDIDPVDDGLEVE